MDAEKDKIEEEGELPKSDDSSGKKRTEFWFGFRRWFFLNLTLLLLLYLALLVVLTELPVSVSDKYLQYVSPIVFWLIPLTINIGAMIYYARKNRPQVSIGMLAAFGATLTICLAFSAVCFRGL
jgi:hypothetical protein